jgi:hypothetical protein
MSAHKSPTISKPSPSNLRIQEGKIPASRSEGRKSGTHAEDGRFRAAADLRLSIGGNRLIGPSIYRRSTDWVLDGPMIRGSDGPINPLSKMCQKQKGLAV